MPAALPAAGTFGPAEGSCGPAAGSAGGAVALAAVPAAGTAVPGVGLAAGGILPAHGQQAGGFGPASGPAGGPAAGGLGPAAGPAAGSFDPFVGGDWQPERVRAAGGYLAPVPVHGLQVIDVFPPALRWKEPAARRVQWELRELRRASVSERAKRLLKMAYWPKLLGQVLKAEKTEHQQEAHRAREAARRRQIAAHRGLVPAGDADAPADAAIGGFVPAGAPPAHAVAGAAAAAAASDEEDVSSEDGSSDESYELPSAADLWGESPPPSP